MNTTQTNLELAKLKELKHKTIKIFGPPGTGKTFTLIEKVLKGHIRKGTNPNNIAFLSFTNKAVNTAVARSLTAFPKFNTDDFSRFKTLHTYCRRYFEEEVFDPKDCMIDFAIQNGIVKRSDTRLSDDNFTYKDWSLGVYSKSRNLLLSPIEGYKRENYKRDSLDIYLRKIRTYEHYKTSGGNRSFIDFDDMIEKAISEIKFPSLDVLILDEAQDCTPLQWSVIYKMADNVKRIYLAGDDDQGIYKWNGADPTYFTDYFPGRNVKLRKTRRFGEAIHHFSQIIRRGILDSVEKEYTHGNIDNYVRSYLNFKELPFGKEQGTWFILGRINSSVNELRMLAKDAGLYFKDNKDNKCFDEKQWDAIKCWTKISNGKKINKQQAQNLYKYIRELKTSNYRGEKFWLNEPDLGKLAKYRRILTGSPVTKSPLDLYTQCEFLSKDCLGFSSYYTFRNRYAIMKEIFVNGFNQKFPIKYINLEELEQKLKSFSYRCKKSECLDLPDKIPSQRTIEMTPEQIRVYTKLKREARAVIEDKEVSFTNKLTEIIKLHQVCCGFSKTNDGEVITFGQNPKLKELKRILAETDEKSIIWANYIHNIKEITEMLKETYGQESVVSLFGEVSIEDRTDSVKRFQNDSRCRFLVGNPSVGGYGLTLTAAGNVIYFSNSYNLEHREQSEDRAHRIGQEKFVNYIDLIVPKTIDELILKSLKNKKALSEEILGDNIKQYFV